MRKAEDYLREIKPCVGQRTYQNAVAAIEQAQREAIEEAAGVADQHDWRGDTGNAIRRQLLPNREGQ